MTTEAKITELLESGHSPGDIAAQLGLDTAETPEGTAVLLDGWIADDGNYEIEYEHAASGEEAAQEYVESGDWGDAAGSTTWITVYAWRVGYLRDEDGDVVKVVVDRDSHSVELEPDDPNEDCDHDWASPHSVVGGCMTNPGVWGHGGGVIMTEVCRRCGIYRKTDTWAQDPSNGVQGLTSVSYREADEASRAWVDGLSEE